MSVGGAVGGSNFQMGTHGATSSLTDFTDKIISVDMKSNGEKLDATTWGSGFRVYEPGFKDVTIAIVFHTDEDGTVDGQMWDIHLNGDTVNWQLGPTGTTTGKQKFTGTLNIDSISTPITVNTVQQFTVECSMAGAVTKGAFS